MRATRIKQIFFTKALRLRPFIFLCIACYCNSLTLVAQVADTLAPVTVKGDNRRNTFTTITPTQSLPAAVLQKINAQSVGDAARYFSGVLIKDYGGVGGLKTISVRSLGAAHTAIVYDGIPVADAQTGQVDLSRFSPVFLQSLDLYQGSLPQSLSPARVYAAASALIINTYSFSIKEPAGKSWQAGIKAGSFGLAQAFGGIYQPLKNNTVISGQAEGLYSKGDYPVFVDNGVLSSKTRRTNSKTRSLQGEVNLLHAFKDSATLQVKTGAYTADRGLPGAIIFFNDRSVQRLRNEDLFIQSRYQKKMSNAVSLLAAAKYNYSYTHYTDPDFLNNQGGLDSRYRQREYYASLAADYTVAKNILLTAATDLAFTTLHANTKNFAGPSRLSNWNNFSVRYTRSLWQVNASLLHTHISDKVKTGTAAKDKNEWTPFVSGSIKPAVNSPFLFRAYYKSAFRMPSFNDLYYNFIGNSSLRPEYARQYNAGVAYSRQFNSGGSRIGLSADGYYNLVRDKIVAVPNQNLFVWTMLNLGKVRIKGIDLTAEANGKLSAAWDWFARVAYTWQQATDITDRASPVYKNRIPYTPDHSGSGLVAVTHNNWEAGYNFLFSGDRYLLGENNPFNHLKGWLTQDVFIARTMRINKIKGTVRAEVNNLADRRYDIVRYYPMPGRSFKVSLLFNHL